MVAREASDVDGVGAQLNPMECLKDIGAQMEQRDYWVRPGEMERLLALFLNKSQ